MKLPTKILLIFAIVFLVVTCWMTLWAIPTARSYLMQREVSLARTNLEMASHEIRLWLDELETKRQLLRRLGKTPAESDQMIADEQDRVLKRLNELYAKFYFHESGRLFVINNIGEFVVTPPQTQRGRTISTSFLFEEGTRNKLIHQINENRATLFQEYHMEEMIASHEIVPKTLFVTIVPGPNYYICLSVDDEDLHYSANLVTKSLTVLLLITMVLIFAGMYWVYTRLRPRYNALIGTARTIANGNYNVSIGDDSPDEVGRLSRTIDALAANLRDKQALERQLRQMQKMELMGSMASGMAHEFNNILAGIRASLDFSLDELKNGTDVDLEMISTTLNVASDCAIRGRDTVERMVAFSRETESHRKVRDLNKLLRNVGEICRHSFDKRIEIYVEEWPEPAVVLADRSQIEQVLLNLCVNARDAMPEGGSLTLSLDLPDTPLSSPRGGTTVPPGTCFRLTVQDNGEGMTPDVLSRVFDPYFTTKELATGLGLSIVYKIIGEHDGWVDIDSQKWVGTTAHVYLPRVVEHFPQGLAESATIELARAREGAQILVADTDSYTVQSTVAQLGKFGHHVTGAVGGAETLRQLTSHAPPFTLVLVDMFMSDLDIEQFFSCLHDNHPKARVLLTTANKRDPRIADMLARGCDTILHKPYTHPELQHAVNAVLQPADH